MAKIILKNAQELDGMRAAGKVAANIRMRLAKEIAPGISTRELDLFARDLIDKEGARSAFINYPGPRGVPPYPGYTCISVNEEVVHGIPGDRKIRLGDIVSIDVGVVYDGFIGDNAMTVPVGVSDLKILELIRVSEQSLMNGIAKAVAGNRLTDISHAIESTVIPFGFGVVRDFVGHGVGRNMHEPPQIYNFGPPGRGPLLKEGMTLAIEPMVNLGTHEVETLSDGWTVVTEDRKYSVHVEHTVAVHDGEPEILTLPDA
ncbi:type I methionyl aminopeptidase [Kiritimatiellota bacterium B12222]|nr:type I methionyl aminopeptidase [Kiritimatiellota bacterium B12222]